MGTSMAVILRALVLLALSGASLALFVQELIGDWVRGFVMSNALSMPNRQRLLVGMAVGALVGAVTGLLVLWRKDTRRLRRVGPPLSPLSPLGRLPQLCDSAAWPNALNVGIVIGAFLLLAERLYRLALQAAAET